MPTLTVVETPAEVEVENPTIVLNPTPVQQAIMNMITLVERDHWTRNTTNDGFGRGCMIGLVERVSHP